MVDAETGEVLSDIQQSVQPDGKVKTKVELPAQGLHEEFEQEADAAQAVAGTEAPAAEAMAAIADDVSDKPVDEDVSVATESDFSPTDMAEYLYFTQQFDAFFAGLDRLVNASKMSAEEASSYAQAVATEYNRVLLQDQAFFEPDSFPGNPAINPPRQQRAFDMGASYPPMGYQGPLGSGFRLSPEEQMYLSQATPFLPSEPEVMPEVLTEEIDPYEFLTALWTEAYGKGNQEAQEIVSMLYNRVSHDGNPDDMGQIKDILLEAAEASFNEENSFSSPDQTSNFDSLSQQSNVHKAPPAQAAVPDTPAELLNTPLVDSPQQGEVSGNLEKQTSEEDNDVVTDLDKVEDTNVEADVTSSEDNMSQSQNKSAEQEQH